MNIINEKKLLRTHFKKLRHEIDAITHFQDSMLACQHAAALLVRLNIQTCAIYHPINSELSPLLLPQLLPNLQWGLPYLQNGTMLFSKWNHDDEFAMNCSPLAGEQVSQGEADQREVSTKGEPWGAKSTISNKYNIPQSAQPVFFTPQAIVTPLLAADSTGVRLGYGGGYYDRYFATSQNAIRIGVGFAFQFTELIPHEPHDAKLDYFISEQKLFFCGT